MSIYNPSVAAGGQSLYDAIVATSGEDYTTLGAAIAAGKTRIYIKAGTYTETGNIIIPANGVIVGEGGNRSIINMQTYTLYMSDRSRLEYAFIQTSKTSGDFLTIRSSSIIFDCDIWQMQNSSGTLIAYNGVNIRILNNDFLVKGTQKLISNVGGQKGRDIFIIGNETGKSGAYTGAVTIEINADGAEGGFIIMGNVFDNLDGGATGYIYDNTGKGAVIVGNAFPECTGAYHVKARKGTIIVGNSGDENNPFTVNALPGTVIEGNAYQGIDCPSYKTLKNTDGDIMYEGDLVRLKAVAAGNEVEHTTVVGDDMVIGIVGGTIANNAFGSIQTLGKTVSLKVSGTVAIAIGDFIGTHDAVGIGQKAGAGDMAIAIALEAYAVDNDSGVIDALLITPRKI